ncbi:D-2-hydroxyacid dehydrogenase [Anaerosacchariphilus sp. NSJ-68]|uniref:D-2-hydroxyacid dehydrogenase n=2 Tax=Lachnospiraceae TaxID=186803 RepID=A0A923LC05_9FIRM|nr:MULTISPECIES: D-2-hydroxyacid dehydrogenase [Lachnospiraceae]MBC5659748.1 D-2-hydroxyacid dehydrogenase [Anaerosacchariphilus hominis]MBC5697414.1 D-2-hydroxyacid dehydrogenase [Roseburia difficilis]
MKILVTLSLDERQKNRLEMNFKHQEFVYCLAEDVTKEVIRDAEVILGNLDPAFLQYAEELKWLQLNNAGTEGFCDGALPKGVMLTNATGAYGLAISEHMIGVLFELQKKLNLYEKNQREHLWKKEGHVQVIEGSRVLVIGLGDIGTAFARKMKALGCRTTGIKRREGRKPEGVDDLYTLERLDLELPKADIVALSLPGNEDTRHILNEERIALLKKNAVVINVGRGITVDTEALTRALQEGRIAGACLDVTDPEPLPPEHPLWEMENVILTPHVSGGYSLPETLERILTICIENLECYVVKRPLRNLIDFRTGYCE